MKWSVIVGVIVAISSCVAGYVAYRIYVIPPRPLFHDQYRVGRGSLYFRTWHRDLPLRSSAGDDVIVDARRNIAVWVRRRPARDANYAILESASRKQATFASSRQALRNDWRISVDATPNQLIVAEVGKDPIIFELPDGVIRSWYWEMRHPSDDTAGYGHWHDGMLEALFQRIEDNEMLRTQIRDALREETS